LHHLARYDYALCLISLADRIIPDIPGLAVLAVNNMITVAGVLMVAGIKLAKRA
jgi:hypothetical protein